MLSHCFVQLEGESVKIFHKGEYGEQIVYYSCGSSLLVAEMFVNTSHDYNMRNALMRRLSPNAKTILYGSEARGDARPDSDIDLLILLDEPHLTPEREQEIIRPLYELEVKTGIIISPMVMLRKLWESRPFQTPFSLNVTNEGIVL